MMKFKDCKNNIISAHKFRPFHNPLILHPPIMTFTVETSSQIVFTGVCSGGRMVSMRHSRHVSRSLYLQLDGNAGRDHLCVPSPRQMYSINYSQPSVKKVAARTFLPEASRGPSFSMTPTFRPCLRRLFARRLIKGVDGGCGWESIPAL